LKISEFLQGRSVARQAVTRYINRHDETFKNHVKKEGKELDLDMVAIEALEKIYPLEMPVNVIDGVPKESFIKIQNELIASQKKIEGLQGQLLDVQEQIAVAKAQELLLEDRTNQVSELKEQINLKNNEIESLKEQLSEEKSKGFFAKIFGRK
jgi:predicted RNase H-like nuclease (RuvC/YqgF family)